MAGQHYMMFMFSAAAKPSAAADCSLRLSCWGISPETVARGDLVAPAVKLAGFLVLLALIFAGAHAAAARLGPVDTGHSRVQYSGSSGSSPGTGGGMNMGGMDMGGTP
jgi:hypothetical protein